MKKITFSFFINLFFFCFVEHFANATFTEIDFLKNKSSNIVNFSKLKGKSFDKNKKINQSEKKENSLNKTKHYLNLNIDGMNIIKRVYTNDGENDNIYSPENPISGMDFWKSKKISDGNYVDWNLELVNNTLIKEFKLEFDFPPTDIMIFSKCDNTNWFPLIHKDISEEFKNFSPNKKKLNYMIRSFLIENTSTDSIRHLKFRFINRLNYPLNILLSLFKLIEDTRKTFFVIRKLVIENGKFHHLCMKYNNNGKTKSLVLENCYYCLLFNLNLCSFNYKSTDGYGHIFYHYNEELKLPFEFYIKNLYDINGSFLNKKNSYSKTLKSYANDILDFSNELDHLTANSTLSEEYGVRNILYDNLDYWSSQLFLKPNCKNVVLELKLKNEIIVKKIVIDWIKIPSEFKLEFCDKNKKCILQSYPNNIVQFRSSLNDIYQKLFILRIILFPQMDSFYSYCIFSIKKISLFKNEILLEPLQSSEIFGTESKINLFYSDNFIVNRMDNVKLGIDQQKKLSENMEISDNMPDKIINIFNYLKGIFLDTSNKGYKKLLYDTETFYRNYIVRNEKSLKLIKIIFGYFEKLNIDSFDDHIKDEYSEYAKILEIYKNKFKKVKKFIHKNYHMENTSNEIKELEKLVQENSNLISQESAFFDETHSDKYKYILSLKMRFVEYLPNIFKKVDFYFRLSQNFNEYEKMISEFENYNSQWTNTMYSILENKFLKEINKYQKEFDSMMNKLEISLQNVKLIRIQNTKLYLKLYNKETNPDTNIEKGIECKMINIVKNSYYDNFFVKFLVNYNQTNFDSENIIILKFLNRRFFYYLKVYFSRIEIWSRDLEDHKLIGTHSILMPNDKFNNVKDFSKLVFVLIKIEMGSLTVSFKIDYNPIPDQILQMIENNKKIDYDKLINTYLEDYNKFQEYYKNCEVIFNIKDINLYLNGYFGYISTSDNLYFLLIARIPTNKKRMNTFTLSSLDSKYKYNYFPDSDKLVPIELDNILKVLFELDDSWKFYKTNFKVINNFYFKFELDMGRIFNNNIFFFIDSDRNDYYLVNQIIRLTSSFLLKIFFVSKNSSRITNVWRTTIPYDKNSQVFAFIYEKSINSLRIKIKSRKFSIKKLFTLTNYSYISFSFVMNDSNKLSLSSIYFTDTYNLNKNDENNDKNMFNRCSKFNYKAFSCPSKDKEFCQIMYCKICCKRTINIEVSQDKCQANCINDLRYNLV